MYKSGWKWLEKCVSQGNGTDYFNKFLNDLFYSLNSLSYFDNYADDNTLSGEDKDINVFVDKLEVASREAVMGFDRNCMQADAEKVSSWLVVKRSSNHKYYPNINDVMLPCTALVKLLWIKIDYKLTFHLHISDLCRRSN